MKIVDVRPEDLPEWVDHLTGASKCNGRGCQKMVFWCFTKKGRKAPLDPDVRDKDGKLVSHWATCPDAKRFRK